jgi:hypothetical protein
MSILLIAAITRKAFWYEFNGALIAILQVGFCLPEYHTRRKE